MVRLISPLIYIIYMYVCTWFNKSINQNVIRCNPLFIVVYPCCGFLWTGHIIRRIDPSLVTTKTFLESNSPNFFFFIVPYSMCAGILEPVWFTVHRIRSKNVNSCLVRLCIFGFPLCRDNQFQWVYACDKMKTMLNEFTFKLFKKS